MQKMRVVLNGQRLATSAQTVRSLLQAVGFDPRTVLVLVQGEILPQAEVAGTVLADGDAVEVVGSGGQCMALP